MRNAIPQGSILGLVLFNIFNNDIDSGVECTLSKFLHDTELSGAADTLEGRDTVCRDLAKLEEWVHVNLMKFNKTKCKVLHVSSSNPQHQCGLGDEFVRAALQKRTSAYW